MKKNEILKENKSLRIIISALCVVALMSATAFAATGTNQTPPDSTVGVSQQVEDKSEYMTVEGTITSVETEKEYTRVTIDDKKGGMIFNVKEGVFVVDQTTGDYLKISDLKKDMKVTAVLAKNAPMTLSIPAQTSGAVGFVVRSQTGSADVSIYDKELLSKDKELIIKIGEDTKIAHMNGNKMAYNADSLKGSELLVLYSIVEASLPAQTTPEFVMILNTADELADAGDEGEADVPQEPADVPEIKYVELRSSAEAKGYEVKWTSNNAPIALTKGDVTAKLTIGSNDFEYTHMTRDIQPLDMMENLSMPVKLENGKTMVPSDFIEALK